MEQPSVEASYKGREVESALDLYFYRKVGYRLALFFAKLRMTPAQVTWCGAALGIAAGHLYYYPVLKWNLLGMALHVLSNAFDNADGQLARLTKQGSRSGRALDGLADNLVFISVYAHLCLRYTAAGGTPLIWLLVLAAGASHSWQSAAGDYFRNAYLYFAKGQTRAELDSSRAVQEGFDQLTWRDHPWRKFLHRLYLNYTRQQEMLAPRLNELKQVASETHDPTISRAYQEASRPLLKWGNLLATNPRMILLFVLLIIGHPTWYFVIELTLLNLVLALLLWEQNDICHQLLSKNKTA